MENNSQSQYKTSSNDIIDIRAILIKYLKKWHWFVISVLLCIAIAFVYLRMTLPSYSVQTSILLRDDKASNPLSQLALLDGFGGVGASKEVEDEIQILTTRTIKSNVIRALGIETEYFVRNRFRPDVEIYPTSLSPIQLIVPPLFNNTLNSTLRFDVKRTKKGYNIVFETRGNRERIFVESLPVTINTPYGEVRLNETLSVKPGTRLRIVTYPNRVLTQRYSAAIRVAPANRRSNAINISTISQTPAKAISVLNKLVDLYNLDAVNERNLVSQNTADFAAEQIISLEKELLSIEVEIEKYKRNHNLTNISSEAELFLRSMSESDRRLAEIQTQINLVTHIDEYLRDEENKNSLIPANLGFEDASLRLLIQEYNTALLERMRLLRSTNEQNPVISQLDNTLATLRSNIIASINSISNGLNISLNDLRQRESQFTARIQNIPTQEREFIELRRRQEATQALYVSLLLRKKENELRLATTTSSTKLLDAAHASLSPVAPKRSIILLVALMFGLAIPLVVIYLLDLLNNKIQDKAEFQRLVHAPFAGTIGQNKTTDPIVVKGNKTTPMIEMFRQLRTNIQFMIAAKKNPVILITSSISGEGKSFVSANLALSLALMKKKIVIIGLDIRNPMLGEYFEIPKDDKGMTAFLSNPDIKLQEIIHETSISKNLYVIQAGHVPPNPTELLMSPRLDEIIAELKETFDYIIIDSAPLGVVSDTYQINRVADTVIYVARQDYTPKDWTYFINENFNDKKLNNMSVLLNGTSCIDTYYGYNHKKYFKHEL